MLDFITINARINAMEALIIRYEATFKSASYGTNEMFTNELKDKGISEVSVWVNLRDMFYQPRKSRNCTINATLRVGNNADSSQGFMQKIKIIEDYLPIKKLESLDEDRQRTGLEWKVQTASFSYCFTGLHIKSYFGFLKSGFDLKNMHLIKNLEKIDSKDGQTYRLSFTSAHKRDVDNGGIFIEQKSHKEIREETKARKKMTDEEKKEERKQRRQETRKIYDGLSLEAEFNFDPPKGYDKVYYSKGYIAYATEKPKTNYLKIRIHLKKSKIYKLCDDYGIKNRSIGDFDSLSKIIDADAFDFYIGCIAGNGDYYKVAEADEIIRKSNYAPLQKKRMMDALRGIALYKGIDSFYGHVKDEKITYPCMESIRKDEHAREAVRNLQKLGINPVTIPARERFSSGRIPNLQDYYVDVTGIEPGKAKQAKRELDKEKRKRREENKRYREEQEKKYAEERKLLEESEANGGGKTIPF